MNRTDVCKHCGQRIVLVNLALGEEWYHQSVSASFMDGAHRECHVTLAEPEPPFECELTCTTSPCRHEVEHHLRRERVLGK